MSCIRFGFTCLTRKRYRDLLLLSTSAHTQTVPAISFRGILNVAVAISSTIARPAYSLSHQVPVPAGQTHNCFWRGSEPSNWKRFRRLCLKQKDSTIWLTLIRLNLVLKWLIIVVVKIEKLMSTHAARLAIRADKVAKKTLLSAILNSKDCTWVYDVVDFKNIRQTSIRIQQTQTKKNPL